MLFVENEIPFCLVLLMLSVIMLNVMVSNFLYYSGENRILPISKEKHIGHLTLYPNKLSHLIRTQVSSNSKLNSLEPETFFYFTLLVSSTADLLRKQK